MKKASATIIYNGETKQIVYAAINYKGTLIPFINYDKETQLAYKHNSFAQMYEAILNIAKHNGFYFDSYKQFGTTWYNIQWIDCTNPSRIDKYGYKGEIKP